DVRVEAGGGTTQAGSIAQGSARTLRLSAEHDSSLRVTFRAEGQPDPLVCNGDVYLTTSMNSRIDVTIGANKQA
ncbi:MAG TPA: hypothetical protein VM687_09620, partial [Stenotrophomonas sp.]|nr:hypothetical protein [Stenotrophomonas sp.]